MTPITLARARDPRPHAAFASMNDRDPWTDVADMGASLRPTMGAHSPGVADVLAGSNGVSHVRRSRRAAPGANFNGFSGDGFREPCALPLLRTRVTPRLQRIDSA